MNLKERLSHFWNKTLGVDYPETEDIEKSNSPEYDALRDSLSKVGKMEERFRSGKGGKGNIVESVSVNEKEAARAARAARDTRAKDEGVKEK